MRTRYALVLVIPALLLLALGAIPSLLGGGEVYYVTATEVELEDGQPPDANATDTIDASNLSTNRFPYALEAIEEGVSEPYETGRFGLKGSFTHTPFDEFAEFEVWNREATAAEADVAWLERNGTYYRLEITTRPDDADP